MQETRTKADATKKGGSYTGRPTLTQVFKGEVNSWLKDGPNSWPKEATGLVFSDMGSEDSLDDVDGEGAPGGWK
jgi:hypothetical protein